MRPQVQASPEHGRNHREARDQVPSEAVLELWKVEMNEPEDVGDRYECALGDAEIDDRHRQGDVFQRLALVEETDQREREECCRDDEVERLRTENVSPGFHGSGLVEVPQVVACGSACCRAR